MVKIKNSKRIQKKKLEHRLIFDEVNLENYKELSKAKEIFDLEKKKELDKETSRINMINDKFKEYNLSITDEEISETYNRLNEYSIWVSMEGCKFHTIFLKVMEFEMIRDNFKDTIINSQPKKEIVEDDFQKYGRELEENRLKNENQNLQEQ